jgi:hypothetical protein
LSNIPRFVAYASAFEMEAEMRRYLADHGAKLGIDLNLE